MDERKEQLCAGQSMKVENGQARAMIGRFAPSPTGPLHFGSLVAATASFLEAKSAQGQWLVRIEDVDAPRVVPGAADGILRVLETFGFEWDGEVVWQSRRLARYAEVLDELKRQGHVFACACSRREMADSSLAADGSRRYPGTCRNGLPAGREGRTWRLRVPEGLVRFEDGVQGTCEQDVWGEVGDVVLGRADGQFAYQLAVVVDDADAGVTEVVRGADLLDSTARQIVLQGLLGLPTPRYAHVPIATDAAGGKLSKQTCAAALDEGAPSGALYAALSFLGQRPPAELAAGSLAEVWQWARRHWDMQSVPRRRAIVKSADAARARDGNARGQAG